MKKPLNISIFIQILTNYKVIFVTIFLFGFLIKPAFCTENVTLHLQWYHQFQFAGYYAAQEKGFYQEEGLNVNIVEGGPGVETFKDFETKSGHYGTAHAAGVLSHYVKSRQVIVVAGIFQHSANVIITRKDRSLNSPHDLVNSKTVIMPGGDIELSAMLLNEGIDPTFFCKQPEENYLEKIIEGKIDAIDGYISNEPYTIQKAGVPVSIISPINYGIDFYGDVLITSKKESREHPARVNSFRAASLRGWEYAMEHPEEIIGIILNKYTKNKSKDHLMFEANAIHKLIMHELVEIGHMNPDRWQHMINTLTKIRVLRPDEVKVDELLYNPNQGFNSKKLWVILKIVFCVSGVIVFIALGLYLFNRKLRREIVLRTKTEAELYESNERYRFHSSILENMSEGVQLTKTSDATIVYTNKQFDDLFGYNRGELINKHVSILNAQKNESSEKIAENIIKILNSKGKWSGEILNKKKNGTEFWCYSNVTLFNHDKYGKVWVAVHKDISERQRIEKQLMESEEKFRSIATSISDAIITIDDKGLITFWNDAAEKTFGYSNEEAVGRNMHDLIAPQSYHNDIFKGMKKFVESGKGPIIGKTLALPGIKKDGTEFMADHSFSAVKIKGKWYATAIIRDITEQIRAKEKLEDSEQRLLLSLESAKIGTWEWNIQTGNVSWDERMQNIFGLKPGMYKETYNAWEELVHPDDKRMADEATLQSVKNGTPYECEYRIVLKSGETRYIKAQAIVKYDSQNQPLCMNGVAVNVTDRKKLELEREINRVHLEEQVYSRTKELTLVNKSLQDSREELKRIFELSIDMICISEISGKFIKINPAFGKTLGYTDEELLSKPYIDFVHPEDRKNTIQVVKDKLLKGEVALDFKTRYQCKDGSYKWLMWNAKPVINEGILFAIAHDITEQKKTEDNLKATYNQLVHSDKLSALGKLTGSIAHEFNNPLYGVSSILEQIESDAPLEEEYKALLGLAIKECRRMSDLVKKLREFYRPSLGVDVNIDINQVIEDMLLLINKKLKKQRITVSKQYDLHLPKIKNVEDKIKQVILNVVQNAEEAMPETGGEIKIITKSINSHIEIEISDTGEGISATDLQNIFNPFFTTKGVKGTGLGLSVCYGIIKNCEGDITVKSKQGEGSCFVIKLPVEKKGV